MKYQDYKDTHRNIKIEWEDGRTKLTVLPTQHGIVVAMVFGPTDGPIIYTGQTYLTFSHGHHTYVRVIEHPYRGEWLARRAKTFAAEKMGVDGDE